MTDHMSFLQMNNNTGRNSIYGTTICTYVIVLQVYVLWIGPRTSYSTYKPVNASQSYNAVHNRPLGSHQFTIPSLSAR